MKKPEKLLYGVAYYDEYMPYDRLEQDIQMMKEVGINVVRIAESTWSTLEPQNGVFNFYHIDRVLDAMYAADIAVIIGTPTYAVPTWMVKEHPDVLAVTREGRNIYGPRQKMDITHPTFLYFSERVIRKLISHVKDHPAVIGYQMDNETKHYDTSGSNVELLFIKHLREKFGTLEVINKTFGLDYWSNRINAWEDFPSVIGTINASLSGEFATFQRKCVTQFLTWQKNIIDELRRDDQWVTHNFDFEWRGYSYGVQPDVNHFEASKAVDIVGVDIYHPSQESLTGCEIAFCGDMVRSLKNAPYLVMETQAQGFAEWVPYHNQLRLQAFSHVASGAQMVAYWHWHSIHNAVETYWKGLLSHDFLPNPTYEEAKTIGRDFAELSDHLIHLKKENRVAIYVDHEALTALNAFKYVTKGFDYNDQVRLIYDALYKMNVGCDFISSHTTDYNAYALVIVPALYAVADTEIERFYDYVNKGGHLFVTSRSGFSDEHVKVRHSEQPGGFAELCGCSYTQFVEAKTTRIISDHWQLQEDENTLSYWMELIMPTTGVTLATYEHPHYQAYSAVVQNGYGKGLATYLGCVPTDSVMRSILTSLVQKAGVWGSLQDFTFPVSVRQSLNEKGKQLRFYLNFSDQAVEVIHNEFKGTHLLQGCMVEMGQGIQLVPWGVAIVEEV